jgi:regulator of replication initiation timing
MTKDQYEENKRLRAENDALRDQAVNNRLKREAATDAMADLAIASIHRFLAGMAAFHVTVCGQPTYEIRFSNDPVPVPATTNT